MEEKEKSKCSDEKFKILGSKWFELGYYMAKYDKESNSEEYLGQFEGLNIDQIDVIAKDNLFEEIESYFGEEWIEGYTKAIRDMQKKEYVDRNL